MTVVETIETPALLSVAMRDGSLAEHKDAEGSAFMERLLAGEVAEVGYLDYLVRLRTVYAAMEEVGRELADDPAVAAVLDADLERLATLDADIAFWAERAGVPVPVVDSPAAEAYAARLRESAAWGGLFVAHHYTRYLGDLSGGQAIGRILAREFDLDGAGVDFYAFPAIPKPKPYKDAYRARLDALSFDEAEKQRVVDEVKVAFNLNQALFEELSTHLDAWRRVR